MNLLLDTHVLIWLMNGDETLSLNARQVIDQTCQDHSLCISAMSIWEIAMLNTKNRIKLNQPLRQWIDQVTSLPFIKRGVTSNGTKSYSKVTTGSCLLNSGIAI